MNIHVETFPYSDAVGSKATLVEGLNFSGWTNNVWLKTIGNELGRIFRVLPSVFH